MNRYFDFIIFVRLFRDLNEDAVGAKITTVVHFLYNCCSEPFTVPSLWRSLNLGVYFNANKILSPCFLSQVNTQIFNDVYYQVATYVHFLQPRAFPRNNSLSPRHMHSTISIRLNRIYMDTYNTSECAQAQEQYLNIPCNDGCRNRFWKKCFVIPQKTISWKNAPFWKCCILKGTSLILKNIVFKNYFYVQIAYFCLHFILFIILIWLYLWKIIKNGVVDIRTRVLEDCL